MTKNEFIEMAREQGADEVWIEEKLAIIDEKEKKGELYFLEHYLYMLNPIVPKNYP